METSKHQPAPTSKDETPAPMSMDDIAMRFLTTPPKPKPAPKKKASKRTK